jgi:threonine/homoserine/homoserine lactone efflux protein
VYEPCWTLDAAPATGIRQPLSPARAQQSTTRAMNSRQPREFSRRDSFAQAFLTNVLNPKAALLFLSVLPQFTHHGGSPTEHIFLLGALDIAIGIIYWLIVVGVAAQLRPLLSRPACRRRWERVTGWL